jgi:hypothetical protein
MNSSLLDLFMEETWLQEGFTEICLVISLAGLKLLSLLVLTLVETPSGSAYANVEMSEL